ncbi:MAG: hypothetical protein JXR71_04755 [Bacteroidales bacterium]|nr:hypothetical protein [Bacteroidales bacterium]
MNFAIKMKYYMKNGLLLILTLGLSFTSYASMSKKDVVKCEKKSTPLKLDGAVDSPTNTWTYDKKEDIYYRLSNDHQNLYVEMKVQNRSAVRKIFIFGFTVWIDPSAKGKDELGINYPIGSFKDRKERTPGQQNNAGFHQGRPGGQNSQMGQPETRGQLLKDRVERLNKRLKEEQIRGVLKGFDKNGFENSFFGSGGIYALAQMDEKGALIYEAVIPLNSIFKNPEKYLKNQIPFSVVFETGYLEQDMNRMRRGGGGMPGGGMPGSTGRYGSGMGRSMSGGSFMDGMMDPTKIRLKRVVLNNN